MDISQLSASTALLTIGILIVAFFIRGIAGFGSGLIAIPLLSLIYPVAVVVPVVGALDYMAAMAHGTQHHKAVQWREILVLLPFILIGVLTALYLFRHMQADDLRRLLGGFVLMYAVYALLDLNFKKTGSRWWAAPAGGLGGLVGTLFGTGGPFYVIYLHLRALDKQAFRATIAVVFLIDGISRIVGYGLTGLYNKNMLIFIVASIPIIAIAMVLGGRVHTSLSAKMFSRMIGLLLIISGTALILQ